MQSFPSLLRSVLRIMLRGGSPERIQIGPRTIPLSLLLAAAGYALALWFLPMLSGPQIAVAAFALVSVFSMAMAWLTRYVPRRRLAQIMVAMLLMLALVGLSLALVGLLPEFPGKYWLAAPLLLVLVYGVSHCLSVALKQQQWLSACWPLAFAAVVYGLYAVLDHQLAVVFA